MKVVFLYIKSYVMSKYQEGVQYNINLRLTVCMMQGKGKLNILLVILIVSVVHYING